MSKRIRMNSKGYDHLDLSLFEKVKISSFHEIIESFESDNMIIYLKPNRSIYYKNGRILKTVKIEDTYIKAHIDMFNYLYIYDQSEDDNFNIMDFDFYKIV